MVRHRRVTRLVALGVGTVLLLAAAPPAAAFAVVRTDDAEAASYAICSWEERATCGHTIAAVAAAVQPGVAYRVRASVTFASAGADRIYVMAQIRCLDGATKAGLPGSSVAQYENLLQRDTGSTMTPTVVATAPDSGSLTCALVVRGTKTSPASPPERYRVLGGWIEVLGGMRAGSRNHRHYTADRGAGVTIGVGTSYDITLASDPLDPAWRRVDAHGELYATTQAPAGASTTFTTELIVAQYPYVSRDAPAGYAGGFCQRISGGVKTWTMSHNRHHQTMYSALIGYPKASCSPTIKVVLRVKVTRGYPLTISGNGTSLIATAVR